MLANCGSETPAPLRLLAKASAAMYPEFVHELQDESGLRIDMRSEGTILFSSPDSHSHLYDDRVGGEMLSPTELRRLEPELDVGQYTAMFLKERSVDPRKLGAAAARAAKHRGIDMVTGSSVSEVSVSAGSATGIKTETTSYASGIVVNCAGAWAGQIGPLHFPTRPVKGQMLSVVGAPQGCLKNVVRSSEVYLVPRSDGRILIGATVEEAGYDKRTIPETIQGMHRAALRTLPILQQARIHEDWAGLRPGTPDDLPILGETQIPGYFVAAGHFRDGILLAPITAQVMSELITGCEPTHDLSAFSPSRFSFAEV
jgi:glycine oxidase